MESNQIPKTGRIGRFAEITEKKIGEQEFFQIMNGCDKYTAYKPVEKANWWKLAVEKLEEKTGKQNAIEVMKTCGSKCCGNGQRKTARKLMKESGSLKEFLEKFINYGVKDGELGYEIIDDNTFITRHNKCFCGQVKQLSGTMKNDIYCQCSVEFNRQFFMAAFEKPVEVKLKQSILTGGNCCEFEITIK